MVRECPFGAPQAYERLRDQSAAAAVSLPDGRPGWLVTKHEYVRQLLVDPRLSSDRAHPGFPSVVPGLASMKNEGIGSLSWEDPPEHTAHRRLVAAEFTVRRTQELRPRIQAIVDKYVGELMECDRPADLVQRLSLPVPALVVAELLGVPEADHEYFTVRACELAQPADGGSHQLLQRKAFAELREYIGELFAAKVREPGSDVVSRLITRSRQDGEFDADMLLGLAKLLLVAGHQSTANMISLGVVALLEHPDQLARVVSDPAAAKNAVEELLRFFSVSDFVTSRVALEDIEIGDVVIPAGQGVIASNCAANRDPEVFADPDVLDIDRPNRKHVAFGYGAHQCIGQHLARVELEIVFTTLFTRMPDLRLAVPYEELPFKNDTHLYGIYKVPVTW